MDDSNIKISYQDLKDPRVDDILAQESSGARKTQKKCLIDSIRRQFAYRTWLFLLVAGLIGTMIIGSIVLFTDALTSLKDRDVEIGASQYVLSKEAQQYITIHEVSSYQKSRNVLIIEEPHFDTGGQINLYKGLAVFFRDNTGLLSKTIFLAEGCPANQIISVTPLIRVNARPSDRLIQEVLSTYLITGYIAYAWKYQQHIPIVGTEDPDFYQWSARLWMEAQGKEDNQEKLALWRFTVVARNRSLARTLVEKTTTYENPILFVGGLHLNSQNDAEFHSIKVSGAGHSAPGMNPALLRKAENRGIRDYLREHKIGYTFMVAVPGQFASPENIKQNISNYNRLFRAQQEHDYQGYIKSLLKEKALQRPRPPTPLIQAVTVSPDPEAAAAFVVASGESESSGNSGTGDGKGQKGEDTGKGKGGKGGKGGDKGKGGKEGEGQKDGDGKKPQKAGLKGGKIEEKGEISEEEAVDRVKTGEDVKAGSKQQAERIARKAGNGNTPIHDESHKLNNPDYKPHYHTPDHGKGHVWY